MKSAAFILFTVLLATNTEAFVTNKRGCLFNEKVLTTTNYLCPEQASELIAAGSIVYKNCKCEKDKKALEECKKKNEQGVLRLGRLFGFRNLNNRQHHVQDRREDVTGDVVLSPILGFQWVNAAIEVGQEPQLQVLPSCHLHTRCLLPNFGEELYGWYRPPPLTSPSSSENQKARLDVDVMLSYELR